jgi:5-(carboxyamino)imidazole ribonucleotide synthase
MRSARAKPLRLAKIPKVPERTKMTRPLAPGATIGILGGGQLGRMLAMAAAKLGFDVHIYTPEADSPASRVAAKTIVAAYDDADALLAFAEKVDVVTAEFENVPAETAAALKAAGAVVRPNPRALEQTQDRITEKRLFESAGMKVAPFAEVSSRADLDAALTRIGMPAILKTRRLGYDGKGQARILSAADIAPAFEAMAGQDAILEGFVTFAREVSIVAARGADGEFAAYDLAENVHKDGILDTSTIPARCDDAVELEARAIAKRLAEKLDYVGVFAIEFFLMQGGALIGNEMAPRVHNSGHWTEAACAVSQFEQHIRAVAGWPLGATVRHSDAVMTNLIGADADDWSELAADPAAVLHLYGKREARPGRKMGHITRLRRL